MPKTAIATAGFARRTALSVGTLLITVVACAASAAQSWNSPQAASPAAIRTVTLITGDRVVINGGDQPSVSVLPRKGRERIAFSTTYQRMKSGQGEHLYVIPADAQPLIGAGRLDRQLFDMTTLLEARYDDAATGTLSVVVTYHSQVGAASAASSSLAGAAVTKRFDSVNGLAANVAKQDLGRFWDTLTGGAATSGAGAALSAQNGPIKKIWLDRVYKLLIDQSVPQIGAPLAWQSGYDGTGVRVGIIDSGYDETHPDLIGKVVAYQETTIPDDRPASSNSLAADHHGHGTHVASTLAGTGAASNGKYRGVAPGADLVIFRACIPRPDIAEEGCTLARILEGMHWTVEEGGARIVSMSLGNWNDPNEVDPLEEAVEQLTAQYGVLFVIAAGNSGDNAMSIHTPGSSPAALTVGAVDKSDELGRWSSRGPIPVSYDIKPDITAPGAAIVAAWAKGTPGGPEGPVGEHYTRASGTSMATPHIAGAAAILLQRYPDWSPAQVKSALMSTARFHPALTLFDQGAGRVDVLAALTTSIVADTPVLNLGFAEFPHEDDPILTRTITYRNLGDAATTLALNVEVRGSDGAAPPAGMFLLDRTTLTLPAGGAATVTLTTNTRVAAAFGMFSGRLFATGGGKTVAIPVALFRERPTYRVTLRHIDRNGAPTPDYVTTLVSLDEYRDPFPFVDGKYSGSGDITLRIPGGRYAVQTHFYKDPTTLLLYPEFVLDATSNLTLDARDASQLTITPPTPTAKTFFLRTEYQATASWGIHAFGIQWNYHGETDGCPDNCRPPFYTGVLGQPAAHVRSYVNEHWEDRAQITATDGPALYTAAFTERGTLTTGTKTIPTAEMSVVRARYATLEPDPIGGGNLGVGVDLPGSIPAVIAFNAGVKFPHQRTEYYYSTEEDVRWYSAMIQNASLRLDAPFSTYNPRQSYITRWNEPPFAPVLPNYNPEVLWSYRTGDTMTVAIPILGDRQAHVMHMPLDEDAPGKLTLYRNGERIAQSSSGNSGALRLQSEVPAEFASYRIEADATQLALPLSTRVKGIWTFQSDHVAAGETTQLPLLTVRFQPTLNERGEAVRDPAFRIPVSVSQLDRQEIAVDVNDLKIEASFDDGVSWKAVPVTRYAEQWLAVLEHPQQGEYVSLRARVKGPAANNAEITVIRAYGLTPAVVSTRK